MPGKRKRTRVGRGNQGDAKRQRISGQPVKEPVVKQAVLSHYYPRVFSLREYLLTKLPGHSKARIKKIRSIGHDGGDGHLGQFLDSTLIGESDFDAVSKEERGKRWSKFSQKADTSISKLSNLSGPSVFSQCEIVDFSIWYMFFAPRNGDNNQHLLCQGFRKSAGPRSFHLEQSMVSGIPGITSTHANSHVDDMKCSPWPEILVLMGRDGERLMIDLILECGIFTLIDQANGAYYQLSGRPLSDLQALPRDALVPSRVVTPIGGPTVRNVSGISFVRSRMLYARPALNEKGAVRFGLNHIHILNRTRSISKIKDAHSFQKSKVHTMHLLMYIFPRQFRLHNVFTSDIDIRETTQPFQDYTMREDEIHGLYGKLDKVKTPKRLRGLASEMARKIQIRHSRCSYKELLMYYCSDVPLKQELTQASTDSGIFDTQVPLQTNNTTITRNSQDISPKKFSMLDFATPAAKVSAFCRACLSRLIPCEAWGEGTIRAHNERIFYRNIDRFVRFRRYENLSLHEVSQEMKISDILWISPPGLLTRKLSQSDASKRLEIFSEFLYFIFDSILIPLLRTNFFISESGVHQYQLFFFRQDVWRSLAEPALSTLKLNMFEQVEDDNAIRILNSRKLGFSQIRLLPKETGVRPIMNLRRRVAKPGSKFLMSSINSVLAPVHTVLTYEKSQQPQRFGSSLFSVGDLFERLKIFKAALRQGGSKPLYFAKVDVQSAFDTIPQQAVVDLIAALPSEQEYQISRHVEIKAHPNHREEVNDRASRPTRRWTSLASPLSNPQSLHQHLSTSVSSRYKGTVFVERIVTQDRNTNELLRLLREHVHCNLVKIGDSYYRQKEGIPQGSVISPILCNYFYADLENTSLAFLRPEESLLLRMVDDSILITTNPKHARRFLQTMHDGQPKYGIRVNSDKSLVSFEATINGKKVPRLVGQKKFPFCGCLIDVKSLNLSRDRERRKDMRIENTLTVEHSRVPGRQFHRKVLNSFKIQSHSMFLDTSFNSTRTVLSNIYTASVECAIKMCKYARCLPSRKQPHQSLITKTISDLGTLAFVSMRTKAKNDRCEDEGLRLSFDVTREEVQFLVLTAFGHVLGRQMGRYRETWAWTNERLREMRDRDGRIQRRMKGVAGPPAADALDVLS